jgi:hypothetical protein
MSQPNVRLNQCRASAGWSPRVVFTFPGQIAVTIVTRESDACVNLRNISDISVSKEKKEGSVGKPEG